MNTPIITLCNPIVYPTQTVNYTAVATHSLPYPPGPQNVYIYCTAFCYVAVGLADVVVTVQNGIALYQNAPALIDLSQYNFTQPWRVSVMRIGAGSGVAYITPSNTKNIN